MDGKGKGRTGRPKGDRNDVSLKVDRRLVEMCRLVAAHEGRSMAELASDLLRPALEKRYGEMVKALEKERGKG